MRPSETTETEGVKIRGRRETIVSDSATLDAMKKKEKTVPIHARLAESDVAEVDKAAERQPIPVSRSHMIALIVREWIQQMRRHK